MMDTRKNVKPLFRLFEYPHQRKKREQAERPFAWGQKESTVLGDVMQELPVDIPDDAA